MTSWTFLIQQEGDNVWLPLESSGSEVLEGRYRVMARTSQSSCPLAIQISHLALDVLPPNRRVRKRQTQTNPKGLVALLPFTLLKPGIWEIHCQWQSSDTSAGATSTRGMHQQTLKLQVLEQESGADLDGAEFYPQDLQDLVVHHNSVEVAETPSPLTEPFTLSLDHDRYEIENDVIPSLSDASPALNQAAQHSLKPADRRSSSIPDKVGGLTPTNDAMECDDDAMQTLLDTADQMAAHIIETMNAELNRIQHTTPPSTAAPPKPNTHNTNSRLEAKTTNPVQSVAPSDDTADYLLAVQPSSQQMWDEDSLKRLGLKINLARDCYTVVNNQLILTGVIEGGSLKELTGTEQVGSSQATSPHLATPNLAGLTLGLRVNLIQPQSGACLLEHDVALPLSTLPAPFSVLMAIPKNLNTHVLVGEVLLAMATASAGDNQSFEDHQTQSEELETALTGLLAQQSFTVTVELGTLLDTVQLQQQTMAKQPRVAPEVAVTEPLLPASSTSTQYVTSTPTEISSSSPSKLENGEVAPVRYNPLPPKLTLSPPSSEQRQSPSVSPKRKGSSSNSQSTLDLPHFLQSDGDRPPSPMAIAIAQAMASTVTPDPAPEETPLESRHQAEDTPSPVVESSVDPLPRLEAPQNVTTDSPLGADLDLSENPFGPLLLDDDITQQSSTKVDEIQPLPVYKENQPSLIPNPKVPLPPVTKEAQPSPIANQEVQPSPVTPVTKENQPSPVTTGESKEEELEQQEPERTKVYPPLPEHIPIPMPTLLVPQDGLIAGMPVRISVTLPSSMTSPEIPNDSPAWSLGSHPPVSLIFVKLWVQDRQTRSILDGPRWLVDFIPNQAGELESMTQLVLPIGCLEVSVEAIAVEMATQRESHKTTLHRSIMPSSMPPALTTFDFGDDL